MTAYDFVSRIKEFAATKEDFINAGFTKPHCDILAKRYIYSYRGDLVNTNNEIINLISNYDVSNFSMFGIIFNKSIKETENFFFFGEFDTDLLGINKVTLEIVVVDKSNEEFIMWKCAANSSSFLDAINIMWRTSTFLLLNAVNEQTNIYIKKIIYICADLAGGEKYCDFYSFAFPKDVS